jgi:hypothetical protein
MPSSHRTFVVLRRLPAAVAVAIVLTATTITFAQAEPTAARKDGPPPSATKNYSIPWVATMLGLAAIIAPVAIATRRKWEMPFPEDEE